MREISNNEILEHIGHNVKVETINGIYEGRLSSTFTRTPRLGRGLGVCESFTIVNPIDNKEHRIYASNVIRFFLLDNWGMHLTHIK